MCSCSYGFYLYCEIVLHSATSRQTQVCAVLYMHKILCFQELKIFDEKKVCQLKIGYTSMYKLV